MAQLIGLTGKARSGKDTIGEILECYGYTTLSFAEPIRNALRAMFGFGYEHFHGSLKEATLEQYGKSPRQMMQTLGTEWGRKQVNEDLWLILAEEEIKRRRKDGKEVVITDVRFENEAAMVRSLGGRVWHVERPFVQAVAAHASEAGVAFGPGDVLVKNDAGIQELAHKVGAILSTASVTSIGQFRSKTS